MRHGGDDGAALAIAGREERGSGGGGPAAGEGGVVGPGLEGIGEGGSEQEACDGVQGTLLRLGDGHDDLDGAFDEVAGHVGEVGPGAGFAQDEAIGDHGGVAVDEAGADGVEGVEAVAGGFDDAEGVEHDDAAAEGGAVAAGGGEEFALEIVRDDGSGIVADCGGDAGDGFAAAGGGEEGMVSAEPAAVGIGPVTQDGAAL